VGVQVRGGDQRRVRRELRVPVEHGPDAQQRLDRRPQQVGLVPGLDPDQPRLPVEHLDPVHRGQVDDDAAVVRRPPRQAVPAAAHRQR
jgi:hypothetical protein